MLVAKTFETRKRLLTFSLAKPRQNAEEILEKKKEKNSLFMDTYFTLLMHFVKMC